MYIHPNLSVFLSLIPLFIGSWKYCYEETVWIPCGVYMTGFWAVVASTLYFSREALFLAYRKKNDITIRAEDPIVDLMEDVEFGEV